MRKLLRILIVLLATGAYALFGAGLVLAAPAATCSNTTLAPGTYHSLTVTGVCLLPNAGTVNVQGGLTIAPNAVLNAITPATINVSGGIVVEPGGSLLLGCSPAIGCDVTTNDHITGGIRADQPLAMLLHSNTINGGVSMHGGGGGVSCVPNPILSQAAGFPAPPFTAFEDNHINGAVSVSGYQSCWFGFIRNHDHGTVTLVNNTLFDPDAMEIVTNTISGNLVCSGNSPAPQVGDSEGAPNVVTGQKLGQCANIH